MVVNGDQNPVGGGAAEGNGQHVAEPAGGVLKEPEVTRVPGGDRVVEASPEVDVPEVTEVTPEAEVTAEVEGQVIPEVDKVTEVRVQGVVAIGREAATERRRTGELPDGLPRLLAPVHEAVHLTPPIERGLCALRRQRVPLPVRARGQARVGEVPVPDRHPCGPVHDPHAGERRERVRGR